MQPMNPVCADKLGEFLRLLEADVDQNNKTNEDISVKIQVVIDKDTCTVFTLLNNLFVCLSAHSHLNNDVQQHSLACPALC